ncbi:MAG: alpha/beta fold hydrolase [Cyanobacteriota bacterium]
MTLDKGKLQNQRTKVNNWSIFARVYAEELPEDAPVVILVHGLVLASRYMIPTAELLASKYRVYVPDFPGYGDSDKPDKVLELPELADVLAQWMDAVGIKQAIMLGNSFGCQIIAEFTLRHSERIAGAILQGPTIDPNARSLSEQLWRFALNAPYERASQLPIQVRDYAAAGLPRVIRTIQMAFADRIEAKLPYMTIPTLVVRGDKDPVVPQGWTEEVVRLLPNGKLRIVPEGAHTLNYSKPKELAAICDHFTQEIVADLERGGVK